MSAPDARGVAIATDCERRPHARTWRDQADRRSQTATIPMWDGSLVCVTHTAPFELAAAMTIQAMNMRKEAA